MAVQDYIRKKESSSELTTRLPNSCKMTSFMMTNDDSGCGIQRCKKGWSMGALLPEGNGQN